MWQGQQDIRHLILAIFTHNIIIQLSIQIEKIVRWTAPSSRCCTSFVCIARRFCRNLPIRAAPHTI